MDSESVKDKVINVVAEKLKKPKEQILLESRFMEDLGADSLDIADLTMEFEDEFDISIPEDSGDKMKTVGDVVKFIEEQVKK